MSYMLNAPSRTRITFPSLFLLLLLLLVPYCRPYRRPCRRRPCRRPYRLHAHLLFRHAPRRPPCGHRP
jgi:hypothetical protein